MRQLRQLDIFIDEWLSRPRGARTTIYCGPGCSGCCNLAVHATLPEALLIAGQLSQEQAVKLNGYIERLKRSLAGARDLKSYLAEHRQSIGPCPFLDQYDRCSIYSRRPLSCRALLSTRPADWCIVDFSKLADWDKQAYESGLDRQIVAWPTHYLAATRELAKTLERELLEQMRQERGWALAGNLAAMVWLAGKYRLGRETHATAEAIRDILVAEECDFDFLLELST